MIKAKSDAVDLNFLPGFRDALEEFAGIWYEKYGEDLIVTSGVRPKGDGDSLHPNRSAADIRMKGTADFPMELRHHAATFIWGYICGKHGFTQVECGIYPHEHGHIHAALGKRGDHWLRVWVK